MTALAERLEQFGIHFTARPVERNPHMETWEGASHYRCNLSRNLQRMAVYFSMGSAHTQPPTLRDVLDCLADDAAGYENSRGFLDWCAEYGYDTDSRKAEATHKTVSRQSAALKRLLGPANYDTLLWHTDRA